MCVTDDPVNHFGFRLRGMCRESSSPSWPPHRLLHCCCELASRVRVLQGGSARGNTARSSIGAVVVGIVTYRRGFKVGPDTPESISTSKFHFLPRTSFVLRRLLALQMVFCELIFAKANHASSLPSVRQTMHFVPTNNH